MDAEVGDTYGRITALHRVFGKEQMAGRSYASVAVMIIRPLLMLQYFKILRQHLNFLNYLLY